MSKNTKENTGEIPKNTITEQNTNIGLDINETKSSKKHSSDGNKKGNNEIVNTGNKSSNKTTNLSRATNVDENNINDDKDSYKDTREFVIFQNELKSLIDNNLYILKECKSTKRLLDIKYGK